MIGYMTRKLVELFLTLLVVTLIVFVVIRIIPGDPAQITLGVNADPESLSLLRKKLGLDKPLTVQYRNWIAGLFRFRFGESVSYHRPVSALILSRLTVTLPLTFFAILIALLLALPLGIFAATRRNKGIDLGVIALSQLGMSIPAFWLGILALMLFSVHLNLLPAGGFTEWLVSPLGAIRSLILPVLTLGLIQSAALTRMTRASALDVLTADYIRMARSKGLDERTVLFKHVLSNSLVSIVTLVGLQVGQMLAGAVVIETVFHLPGLGRMLILAVQQRDLQLVQGIVVVLVGAIIIINFLVDVAYSVFDPRIRLG